MSEDFIEFICPYCGLPFIVAKNETNCRIIRHFVYQTGEQLNPHAPREECDRVISQNLGYGCARPVYLSFDNNQWKAVECDYI